MGGAEHSKEQPAAPHKGHSQREYSALTEEVQNTAAPDCPQPKTVSAQRVDRLSPPGIGASPSFPDSPQPEPTAAKGSTAHRREPYTGISLTRDSPSVVESALYRRKRKYSPPPRTLHGYFLDKRQPVRR